MGHRQKTMVVVAVALGTFLGAMDTTIVGTAMPTVAANLGGLSLYSWVFAAYMLTATISAPIFGKLSDLLGRKALFIIAITVFLVGSALCGASQTMAQLIVFRALQGIGGGALFALAATIIAAVFSPTARPKMQGIMQAMWATASIVGPAAGGLIVGTLGWRWTFYVNLPIGIFSVLLILYGLREQKGSERRIIHVDYAGSAFLALGVAILLLAVLKAGQSSAWTSTGTALLLLLALLLLVVFFFVERHAIEPIVPLHLFRNRMFAVSNSGNFLTGLALFGSTGFIPLFVQGVLQGSPMAAGAALTPLSLGWPAGSIIAGQMVNRAGYRGVSTFGIALMTLGFYLLTRLDISSDPVDVGRNVFIIGLGMGLLAPTLLVAIQNNVQRAVLGAATSSSQFFQTIGGTLGATIMGAVMANAMYSQLGQPGVLGELSARGMKLSDPQALMQPELRSQLPVDVVQLLQSGLANALHDVFLFGLIVLAAGVIIILLIPNSTPRADMARLAEIDPN